MNRGAGWLLALTGAACAAYGQDQEEVEIVVEEVAPQVYMLTGRGGNVGVSAGEDGVFLIDDQYAPMTPAIRNAVSRISDQSVRFVFNTHWHGDHTGGNENFGKAGALIVAHANVRERLAAGQLMDFLGQQRQVPPAPEAALPVVTFDGTVTFHLNGDDVRAFHVRNAHTDGDAIVHFRQADVVHMGDTYFNGFYPFIDASSGGTLAGMIAAVEEVLEMVGEDTAVIPGHGPLANRAELQDYHAMLEESLMSVRTLVEEGRSLEEVIAARPLAELDPEWGDGFIEPDQWVETVYRQVSGDL
ncbi:MBL fold metallo-hydrolase [soil metagenome]